MIIVYVGLIPFSILTAYTRRTTSSRWWFQIHRAINVSSSAKCLRLQETVTKCGEIIDVTSVKLSACAQR